MAQAGKGLVIKVGTSDTGPFTTVEDMNEASMSLEGDNQDVSTFGSAFIKRLQGLKDASYELSGFYNMTAGSQQDVIRDALLNDTELFVQFLPDGTTGFQQEVKVSTFEPSASADGVIEQSIELEGTDAITLV
jgi:predicted secreted protein